MTANGAVATTAKPIADRTERGYVNGSALDGHSIENPGQGPRRHRPRAGRRGGARSRRRRRGRTSRDGARN